ncbi:MAG: hypothetical protein MI919_16570 [Holophagales bacterium]|nr:hypothetical protein [Holophagales bacterium]
MGRNLGVPLRWNIGRLGIFSRGMEAALQSDEATRCQQALIHLRSRSSVGQPHDQLGEPIV